MNIFLSEKYHTYVLIRQDHVLFVRKSENIFYFFLIEILMHFCVFPIFIKTKYIDIEVDVVNKIFIIQLIYS